MKTAPDVTATIRLFETAVGGRKGPTPLEMFGCTMEIEGELFECRLDLMATGRLHPGQTATVPICFLNRKLVLPYCQISKTFYLCEGRRRFTDGVISEVALQDA